MKRKILLAVLSFCLIFTYGCRDKQTQTPDIKNQTTNQQEKEKDKEETSDEKDDEKDQKDEKEDIEKEETKQVKALYFKDKKVFVFDKTITDENLEKYISKESKDEFGENTILNINLKDKKIESVKKDDDIEILAKYIGLSDATSAQFSYNSKTFALDINQEQIESLDKVQDDQLLEIEITNPQKENGNFVLKDFKVK